MEGYEKCEQPHNVTTIPESHKQRMERPSQGPLNMQKKEIFYNSFYLSSLFERNDRVIIWNVNYKNICLLGLSVHNLRKQ